MSEPAPPSIAYAARALLLTDVVDSTKLAESLGDAAMAALWARHDRVARDLLPTHRGREIDKTDGFLLLFDDCADAVAYALAYHRAIAELEPPLTARAGLHVGPVILTANAPADVALGAKPLEVDGLAKPTAARVMGLATSRQTLLTTEAREALGPTALRVVSHGHWRMKGLSEPVELFEVGGDEAPFAPPADSGKVYRVVRRDDVWLPVRAVDQNLPRERDPFVGRGADLRELARRLDGGASLVSVLGIGGTGKTRLVVRFGWTWLGDWPGGVWFVDLSEVRDANGVAAAVARAMDVNVADDPIGRIGHAIASRGRCLVLLDNFEQVAREAHATVGRWLERAREAVFVVTTREILGLPGEEALALAPLSVDEAVTLFEIRAAAAKRGFATTAEDRAHVRALVELLDRLPLCIELAAARVRVMTPQALVARMGERFQLLATGGARRDRQSTLRATLDWSWDLLGPAERSALAQLSVFEGGFLLDAAEGVVDLSEDPDAPWTLDVVQSLVDKSLVFAVGESRLDLLVSVQAYAAEKLAGTGLGPGVERAHAAWFARFGTREALESLHGPETVERRRALAAERDNLLAACRRACLAGDGGSAVGVFLAVREVLQLQGPLTTLAALAEQVLAVTNLTDDQRAWVGMVASGAAESLGLGGGSLFAAAQAAARGSPDRELHWALAIQGARVARRERRMDEWREAARHALALAQELRSPAREAASLSNLVDVHRPELFEETVATLRRALSLAVGAGHAVYQMVLHSQLAWAYRGVDRTEDATRETRKAIEIAVRLGAHANRASLADATGYDAWAIGDMAAAEEAYRDCAAAALHTGVAETFSRGLGNRGSALAVVGRYDEAIALHDRAIAAATEVGDVEQICDWSGALADELRLRGDPGAAREVLGRLFEMGDQLPEAHRGLAMVVLSLLELEAGRPDLAWSHLQPALALPDSDEGLATRKRLAAVRVLLALGDATRAGEVVAGAWEVATSPHDRTTIHLAEAMVAASQGQRAAAEAALGEATALPQLLAPASELSRLVAAVRAELDAERPR